MKVIEKKSITELKIGMLGGGQLGKMLVNAAAEWGIKTYALDPSKDCPAASICHGLTQGHFTNFDDVYAFGRQMDVVTVEIENVNIEALEKLEKEGVTVYPSPGHLKTIIDKGLQKEFYHRNGIPTAPFALYGGKEAIIEAVNDGEINFPFVQKVRTAGYDGKGVKVVNNGEDLKDLLDGASVVEEKITIEKELAVIAAKNSFGEVVVYPPVEMAFNPKANLVEFLFCPAEIDEKITREATDLAVGLIKALDLTGLLAVEMFLDKNGHLYINEVAPRPHNSGHHTIESAVTSQYEQHIRAILGMALGDTQMIIPSVMVNLLGEPGYQGRAVYEGLEECMKINGAKIHLYGKSETKPFRKMGHVTVIDKDVEKAKEKARKIKKTLRIIS